MEDVTDAAFRRLIARTGKPDVMFTEFTSADGLVLAPEAGQKALRAKLMFDEGERPIVAQLFSSIPERMEKAAAIVAELGFDGIDINMGCPDKAVEKSGCGAALIKNPERAKELIQAAKRGGGGLPVSVKTRMGYSVDEMDSWLPVLLGEEIANLTVHLRTRKEMSLVPAHWDQMSRVVAIRDRVAPQTLVSGNGDVTDLEDARAKAQESGCDGVMLGRAIYGNPWLYRDLQIRRTASLRGPGDSLTVPSVYGSGTALPAPRIASESANLSHDAASVFVPTPQERITALSEHIRLFDELLGHTSNFATMKKHFKAYISGWDHAKELRTRLMETHSADEAITLLTQN